MKAQLALAGALFEAGVWVHAAREYATAGAWASELGDAKTQVDALRMAAWAFERGGQPEDAWAMGLVGLEIAEGMRLEELDRSTAPWLGELLLRLSERGAPFMGERVAVGRRLGRLLGSGWRRS